VTGDDRPRHAATTKQRIGRHHTVFELQKFDRLQRAASLLGAGTLAGALPSARSAFDRRAAFGKRLHEALRELLERFPIEHAAQAAACVAGSADHAHAASQ
jgi:hypothetical protein